MIIQSKYTKIFKSHDMTRLKYNELQEDEHSSYQEAKEFLSYPDNKQLIKNFYNL